MINGKINLAVLLDLKKTFDVVDHSFVISWKISFT
jgi:hypothetical protein